MAALSLVFIPSFCIQVGKLVSLLFGQPHSPLLNRPPEDRKTEILETPQLEYVALHFNPQQSSIFVLKMVAEEVNLYKYYTPSIMLVITVSKFTVMHTCKVIITRQWFTYHYDRRPL